tara:strand:+ start:27 stop:308 length:282 start_codon:yes stop_codon:yes gene_type:complete
MLKINNPITMEGLIMKKEEYDIMNGIVKTTLNKLPKNKRDMFYRKAEQIFLIDRWYSINHYNRCDKTYSVDSLTNGYANEIFLKATTTVYYER